MVLLLADQGRFQALLDETLADPADGSATDVQGVGNAVVKPGWAAWSGIGLEENAGVDQLLGSGFACGDQVEQGLAFFVGQGHEILLHEGSSRCCDPSRKADPAPFRKSKVVTY